MSMFGKSILGHYMPNCIPQVACFPGTVTSTISKFCLFYHSTWKFSGSLRKINRCKTKICSKYCASDYQKSSYRHCSTNILSLNKNEPHSEEYKMFYKFPYVVHARVLNRLKLYQTGVVVVALPISAFAYYYNTVSLPTVEYFCGISILACVMLYIMGQFFRRLVGMMYLNKEMTMLKVSHLTFWGKRNDIILPVSSVVPLLETSSRKTDLFYKLQTYESDMNLYFSLKYGDITQKDMFHHVFGSTEHL